MPFDKKACDKAYREANKEKLAAQNKAWREANKDKIKAYREANKDKRNAQGKAWREANKDRQKKNWADWQKNNREKINAYIHTDQCTKSHRMSNWRIRGVNNVNNELYDYFMNCDKCEACGGDFTDKNVKCLDHNHETGDFRYVLCNRCNVRDNWKKFILNHNDNA